jgi:nucleotide-binding universal stress UspA family protein
MLRDIIVPVRPGSPAPSSWPAEGYALSLATLFDAHVTALAPSYNIALTGVLTVELPSDLISALEKRADDEARSTLGAFEERARRAGVRCGHEIVRGGPSQLAKAFAARAVTCDLAIVPQPEEQGMWERELVEAALFGSGRPVLIVPYIHRGEARLDRVVIAWDGGKEAARAVHDALPLLARAKSVDILTIHTNKRTTDDFAPGADLATHLARHGHQVTAKSMNGVDIGVGELLLSYAADVSADLIVMGGYAHSRLRHFVFGGATSGILKSMTAPVFMAH